MYYKIYGYHHIKKHKNQRHKQQIYKPSRIWSNFKLNLHPTMIYINNNINLLTFIQLYIELFEITATKTKPHSDNNIQCFSENELNSNTNNKIEYNIEIYSLGYKTGNKTGITDTIQYLAPEYLYTFEPQPIIERHKSKKSTKQLSKMISLSLHSNPFNDMKQQNENNNTKVKFVNHKTEPSPTFEDHYSNDIIEDYDHETISNIFLSIDTKHLVTMFNGYFDGYDCGAQLSDNECDINDIKYDIKCNYNGTGGGEHGLKNRIDVNYLPQLWNLSNICSCGVILFILLNCYPPFEKASFHDKWYKEIVKNKFDKFWKLQRASPINAIPIPTNNNNNNNLLETLNVNKMTSISVNNVFVSKIDNYNSYTSPNSPFTPFTPVTPTSPNTMINLYNYNKMNNKNNNENENGFFDDESVLRKGGNHIDIKIIIRINIIFNNKVN